MELDVDEDVDVDVLVDVDAITPHTHNTSCWSFGHLGASTNAFCLCVLNV